MASRAAVCDPLPIVRETLKKQTKTKKCVSSNLPSDSHRSPQIQKKNIFFTLSVLKTEVTFPLSTPI